MTRTTHLLASARPVPALLIILALLTGSLAVAAPVAATTRGDGLRAAANQHRIAGGLSPVVGTSLLDNIADHRAAQMVAANSLEHNMGYITRRLDRAGVCYRSYGEIIAWVSGGTYSYDSTMDMWWASPPHHDIIMTATFNAAGGSWATAADGGHYSVMVFVELCGSAAVAANLLLPSRVYDPDRPMVFRPGTHTGYVFSSGGDVLAKQVRTLDDRRRGTSAGRVRVNGHAYLLVSDGPLSGYWVRERGRSFVRGVTQRHRYASDVTLRFAAGTYTGFHFDRLGHVTARLTATLAHASLADASQRAIINGRPYFRVVDGIWGGYWVRDTRDVTRV